MIRTLRRRLSSEAWQLDGAQRLLRYLAQHPEELVVLVKSVSRLRLSLPLPALRWLAAQPWAKRWPRDVEIEAAPPGLRVAGTLDVAGASIRAGAVVTVEDIAFNSEELRVALRLTEVRLASRGDRASAISALIDSGTIDLSQLGELVARLPNRPPVVVTASGQRIVLDLKRLPALAGPGVGRVVGWLTPWLSLAALRSGQGHLEVQLRLLQNGWRAALSPLRRGVSPPQAPRH